MLSIYPLSKVHIHDPFWQEMQQLLVRNVLPYQWEILNDRVPEAELSHCIENFRIAAGDTEGSYHGAVFQDSDVYKWLEAVAYGLTIQRDEKLEACADSAIDIICRAQCENGYLNTYYTIKAPNERFMNLTEGHELYCAGHLFEAAVAYAAATGKTRLLDTAVRFAEHLKAYFQPGPGENRGYPGHPEIELALYRLAQATGREEFAELAEHFLNLRGTDGGWKRIEAERGGFERVTDFMFDLPFDYYQEHQPIREQRKATGHAVRAMYLYSAMADMALRNSDKPMAEVCGTLYENVVKQQMYVTGGIGSAAYGERFTIDYDLPNERMYNETCASVGLMMFSSRMWQLTKDAACYDVWEKALYNTVLAGMSRDGEHFFYVNPLSVVPDAVHVNKALEHVETVRPRWFGVSCCPTNLARTVLSLGGSLLAKAEDGFYVLSHMDCEMACEAEKAAISHEGDQYCLKVTLPKTTLKLRIPDGFALACSQGEKQDGYLCIAHPGGEAAYAYQLTPKIRVLHAHPRIAADAGKVCVAYGQSVYCLEEADNGKALCELRLPKDAAFEPKAMSWLPAGMPALQTQGVRLCEDGWESAYRETEPIGMPVTLTFIPYSQWNNRGEGEMQVWVDLAQ